MPWSARFVDPIILPDGRKLLTLRDAATYITAPPKAEHAADAWQTAMATLLLVAERDGPNAVAERVWIATNFTKRNSPKS